MVEETNAFDCPAYLYRSKPPLKWAGGKRWLVPHLLPLWEPYKHRRLAEPLCGGLAVTLALLPQKALLNDVNTLLINFFRWLQKGFQIDLTWFWAVKAGS